MSYREHHITNWGIARNLIGPTGQATAEGQAEKTQEELDELKASIAKRDRDGIRDDIGDIYVTIVLQAAHWGLTMDECIDQAWNEIKNRTGMMLQGKFVKQANLDSLSRVGFQSYQGRLSMQTSSADERDAAISAANANGLTPKSHWLNELKAWEVSVP